jgi:ABC-type lipopolysaccharide export system ATPase subunit
VGILGPCEEESEALLEVAACVVQPDKGQVRLDQIDLTRLKRARREELRRRHVLSVDSRLPGAGTTSKVRGYVGLYPLAEHKISNREAAQRAQLGLDQLGISDLAQRPLARLTFWERVLVEFTRIVVARPRFVVITELFDGLGAAQAQEARRLLRSLVDEIGCGVLLRAADLTSAWVASRVRSTGWALVGLDDAYPSCRQHRSDADDKQVLGDHDLHVLRRSSTAALSCAIRRVQRKGAHRHP